MQQLQLSIPEPCHQSWQQMTPTEQGRFCNACAKEVIDFSSMTDIQVLNYFTNMTNEKVCGRALPEQLDRTLSRPEHPKKKLFWYWNYFVVFFMFFAKGNSAKAQGNTQVVTATDLNKIKPTNIYNALSGKVGEVAVSNNRIITGKVTDKNGNPISFASVRVKGTSTGISADANGAYSFKANSNTILFITGATFKSVEVVVGSQSAINTVLEKIPGSELKEIYVGGMLGGISYNSDVLYSAPDKTRAVAVIKVKDEETGKFLPKASVIINSDSFIDTVFTDAKGIYKIKGIESYDRYFIKVNADGYEFNEFTIEARDFKDRKKTWEVLLRKQKIEIAKVPPAKIGKDFTIRIHCGNGFGVGAGALYVVDGTINPIGVDINPDDVEDYSILQGPAATALFGSAGSNGAVVIKTKLKIKNLDTVTVSAYPNQGRLIRIVCTSSTTSTSVMGSMVKGETIRVRKTIADSLKIFSTKIGGTIKLFPNPVLRGQQFSIALKLKQTGLYQMQITDAAGKIVLQKQFNANAKEVTQKLVADSRWASGLYYLSVFDNKNNLTGKTSFIFE